jgi:hypothetical protein
MLDLVVTKMRDVLTFFDSHRSTNKNRKNILPD